MNSDPKHNDALGLSMLPFVMRELAATVMKRKSLPLEDAVFYIYSSRMYRSLLDENTKLWYQSTSSLYDDLEKEKAGEKERNDSPGVLLFLMFCVENYREAKKMSAEELLVCFVRHGVFEFLRENYEMLHTQDTCYILDSITAYIRKRR